ncbi:diphosphomevalonate decarboxylase [Candidatus Shapirobacteria bacterium CG09_land_8_20_14_0_10_39_12]|uniref:diphosphomevalonate decarboxylase n=2 Tax=Candidatus Shapironibacteriota TaxID=1752721 RepID=A0A2M8L5A3_9BACT|nr:MAG: diphosphomevalonate decarboxylase [Candidatus Shapirobacteria bacterium CG09_land_8_20_14_0_10_39_12]PJE69011.1 MAG: diphosphomevalonate decarboxylase [Candidatus Shapirobacteria bacterium CG10_big_fil_rev_8_21_14_0_10_38_14]
MSKVTAKAPANIAFIKYWGKKDEALRLPLNSSLSMNLSHVFTLTTVDFLSDLAEDEIEMGGEKLVGEEAERIIEHLERVRKLASIKLKAKVKTKNNFPKGTGIASSASGFAALTLASTKAAGLNLSEKKLSILARLGSGSACRSIPDGFVEWLKGNSHQTSYAHSLYPPDYWDLVDIIAVVTKKGKKVSSAEGHGRAESSLFLSARVRAMGAKVRLLKKTFKEKNFTKLGEIIEEETLNMHAVMMTSKPSIIYWLPKTIQLMLAIRQWRQEGLESYFTIDAGATVHIICLKKDAGKIKEKVLRLRGIDRVIVNYPASGAKLVKSYLF